MITAVEVVEERISDQEASTVDLSETDMEGEFQVHRHKKKAMK